MARAFDPETVNIIAAAYDAAWQRITSQYPFFMEHQAKTDRQIPVVTLVKPASG